MSRNQLGGKRWLPPVSRASSLSPWSGLLLGLMPAMPFPSFYQHLLTNSVPEAGRHFEDTMELPILGIKGAHGGRANEAGVKGVSLRTGPAG